MDFAQSVNGGRDTGAYPRRAALRFLFLSSLCQVLAFGGTIILRELVKNYLSDSAEETWMLFTTVSHSALAYIGARFLTLPKSWQIFNLLAAPITALSITYNLSNWVLGGALAALLLVYLPTYWTHVPYYPTDLAGYEALLELLPKDKISFVDLGCGFGRLLGYLATKRKDSKFYGLEIGPLPWLICKIRSFRHNNLKFKYKSLWNEECSNFSVVYAFLSPEPMEKLWQKLQRELRPGSLFISNSFPVPNVDAEKIVTLPGKQSLHLYIIRK